LCSASRTQHLSIALSAPRTKSFVWVDYVPAQLVAIGHLQCGCCQLQHHSIYCRARVSKCVITNEVQSRSCHNWSRVRLLSDLQPRQHTCMQSFAQIANCVHKTTSVRLVTHSIQNAAIVLVFPARIPSYVTPFNVIVHHCSFSLRQVMLRATTHQTIACWWQLCKPISYLRIMLLNSTPALCIGYVLHERANHGILSLPELQYSDGIMLLTVICHAT
jgi:hypothetical protein